MGPTKKSSGTVRATDPTDELDELEGISAEELDAARFEQDCRGTPATAQQEVDDQAEGWSKQWGCDLDIEEPKWPADMGEGMAELLHDEVLYACKSFPNHTGLGWDRWHPKVVTRLSKPLVQLLVLILMECEREGIWPEGVALVLIALLPKGEGEYRPIGLLPSPPRIWMRARRSTTRRWEAANSRWWLYAGKGMGADVAAWKQAAAAEMAATMEEYAKYAQALLDLVKAFDRVPIWLLIREAVEMGYPLDLLRLSVAAYRLKRVIRIGRVVSFCVWALRGITAGSGNATTEMRLVMIRAVDRARLQHPAVTPTLFVDDLAASICAPAQRVVDELGGFIEIIADFITSTGQELSPTKSVLVASSKQLGEQLIERWEKLDIHIKWKEKVKALGVGLAAGRLRNAAVAKARHVKYAARLGKFQKLQRIGVSTKRLVRTGLKALTYGSEILGVPCGMLKGWRQTVAAMTAPGNGVGGQNLDMALIIADEKGKADPAFDAHTLPIGQWAMAVWEGWETEELLNRIIRYARWNLTEAKHKWSKVYGPAAAVTLTCRRLGWQVEDATTLVTDEGVTLHLRIDPPIVIIKKVVEAVKRWRWRRVELVMPQLGRNGSGRGALIEPIQQLLSTKKKDANWLPVHKGALRSAWAGRQFPQVRVMKCGWSLHNKCIFCLHDIVEKEAGQSGEAEKRGVRDPVVATEAQIAEAPTGDLLHRAWSCHRHDPKRKELAPEADVRTVKSVDVRGHPAWERALVARPPLPKKKKAAVETFIWHVRPASLPLVGKVYTDGSARDGPIPELIRCGWSFVVADARGEVIAAAYGVPPPWVDDIGGAEVWALYQALMVTLPSDCEYWVDCMPVLNAIEKGVRVAKDPRNPLARAHALMLPILADEEVNPVGWMPAHLTLEDLVHGIAAKSNLELVDALDIRMNDIADRLAKQGAKIHRVPKAEVEMWHAAMRQIKDRARWIGVVTHEANSSTMYPFSDSESARWKAEAAQRRKSEAKQGADGRRSRLQRLRKKAIPPHEGGHVLVRAATGRGWICSTCRQRTLVKATLEAKKCTAAKKAWDVDGGSQEKVEGTRQHVIQTSGTVKWCGVCGSFAETRAQRLTKGQCSLAPAGGGPRAQLMKLRAGKHPVTGATLPQARWGDGTLVQGTGTYARLNGKQAPAPDGFVEYCPRPTALKQVNGTTVHGCKKSLMFAKIRRRERDRHRRLRLADIEAEAKELYDDFVGSEAGDCEIVDQDDGEMKIFWDDVVTQSPAENNLFKRCSDTPRAVGSRPAKCSRLDRLRSQ